MATDPTLGPSNPNVKLYLLAVESMADDIQHKRRSVASARVELQKTYVEIRDREAKASREAIETSQRSVERVLEEAQRQSARSRQAAADREAARREATDRESLEALQARAGIEHCIEMAKGRYDAYLNSLPAGQRNLQRNMDTIFGAPTLKAAPAACERDPQWYATISDPLPRPPQPTRRRMQCDPNGMGGFDCSDNW